MDEIDPRDLPLMRADALGLLSEPLDQPVDRVGREAVDSVLSLAGARQLPVVFGPRQVVMVAQQMAGGLRQPRLRQDGELDQPRRAPVAVAERMYPDQIEMGEDRLEDRERMAVVRRQVETVEDFAQPRQQVFGVLPARAAIGVDGHVRGPDAAGRHMVLHFEAVQDHAVQPLDELDGQGDAAVPVQLADQQVASRDDVVDFLPEIALRRRQRQLAVDQAAHLVFGQGVALDGGRRQDALGQIEPVQVVGDRGVERRAGDVLDPGDGFAEGQPVGMFQPPEIEGKGQPRMRPLVWTARCRLRCHLSCPHNLLPYIHILATFVISVTLFVTARVTPLVRVGAR